MRDDHKGKLWYKLLKYREKKNRQNPQVILKQE